MIACPLSDPAPTLHRMSFHPWRALRAVDVDVRWSPMPGRLGSWSLRERRITMDPRQSQAQKRCTITHELVRVERGHDGPQPPAVDLAVRKEAAKRLISIYALADAIVWTENRDELAYELWVDRATVDARLDHLHPAEAGYLRRRLAARDNTTEETP